MATYSDSLLILNGKSAGNDLLRQAIQGLREDGARIHVRVTWEKGDAARYINEASGLASAPSFPAAAMAPSMRLRQRLSTCPRQTGR